MKGPYGAFVADGTARAVKLACTAAYVADFASEYAPEDRAKAFALLYGKPVVDVRESLFSRKLPDVPVTFFRLAESFAEGNAKSACIAENLIWADKAFSPVSLCAGILDALFYLCKTIQPVSPLCWELSDFLPADLRRKEILKPSEHDGYIIGWFFTLTNFCVGFSTSRTFACSVEKLRPWVSEKCYAALCKVSTKIATGSATSFTELEDLCNELPYSTACAVCAVAYAVAAAPGNQPRTGSSFETFRRFFRTKHTVLGDCAFFLALFYGLSENSPASFPPALGEAFPILEKVEKIVSLLSVGRNTY